MTYFLKDTKKSRKVHNNECSLCLCAFCCALRRPRISCDSLTKVPVFVLKRYNFCLWSFKFRENFVPIWKTILFLCISRCKQTCTVCYGIKRRIKFYLRRYYDCLRKRQRKFPNANCQRSQIINSTDNKWDVENKK